MANCMRFDERVVIVTGAGRGLGKSHALAFARRGAKLVINDIGGDVNGGGASVSAADEVVKTIQGFGGTAVANYDSVENGAGIVQTAMDKYGRVDVVVNNAGILRDRSFVNMSEDEWGTVYRVHLLGAFRVIKAAWPIMREQGYGRIVNTSSASGIYGNFGQANYSTAKLGLHGLTQTLAQEGAAHNICVNSVAPVAGSRMMGTIASADLVAALKPEFVSALVLRLCAEHSSESGSLFEAGGGWMAKLRWQRNCGLLFDPQASFDADDVDAQWEGLCEFTDVEYPLMGAEKHVLEPAFTNLGFGNSNDLLGPK